MVFNGQGQTSKLCWKEAIQYILNHLKMEHLKTIV